MIYQTKPIDFSFLPLTFANILFPEDYSPSQNGLFFHLNFFKIPWDESGYSRMV